MNRERAMAACYDIPGQLWPLEQGWLFDTMRQSKKHVEVGVYAGRSLFATCLGMEGECSVLAIDPFFEFNTSKRWIKGVCLQTIEEIHRLTECKVSLIEKTSVGAFTQLKDEGPFDSVFIDALHCYEECKADIEMWSSLIKPGGLVSGHDYWAKDSGVMQAVNETGPFNVVPNTRIWYRRKGETESDPQQPNLPNFES